MIGQNRWPVVVVAIVLIAAALSVTVPSAELTRDRAAVVLHEA